jgi:hypothetical protein
MDPGLARPRLHKTTYAPMIYTSLRVRFWIWADRLRGEVGGRGWRWRWKSRVLWAPNCTRYRLVQSLTHGAV